MATKKRTLRREPRRPGAQRGEVADRPLKTDANFKQSRDIREDRAARQMKFRQDDQTLQRRRLRPRTKSKR